jgi:flavin reductase (DIM6/NTAB) family NADH-FMN oxidoreductase RutF
MSKISMPVSNDFCPQTLFVYGTYKEDGTPDFGLFCWFSYIWDKELGIMACIGGEKLTKQRIHANGMFSANLVTEEMLPLADYFGNKDGASPEKMDIPLEVEKGRVLNVPILSCSPVVFELEVKQFLPLEGSEVILCSIKNVLAEEGLTDREKSVEQKLRELAPVSTTCQTYFTWDGKAIGSWGQLQNYMKR